MKNNPAIYKIETISGFYIGSAVKPRDRRNQHLSHLRRGIHANTMLQRAFDKYGENGLKFSIVEECGADDLLNREQFYLDTLKPKYNILREAGRVTGFVMSEESKAKRVKTLKERYTPEQLSENARKARASWTDESKAKQIKSLTGRKIPREIVEKTRKHLIGRPCSPETRAKIAMQKGWKQKPEAIEKSRQYMTGRTGALCSNSKPVYCSNGMFFHAAMDAQRWLRGNGYPTANSSKINLVCNGKRNKAYNLFWSREPIDSIKYEIVEGKL